MVWPILWNIGRTAVTWAGKQIIQRPLTSTTVAHIASDGESTKAIRYGVHGAVTAGAVALGSVNPAVADTLSEGAKNMASSTVEAWSDMASEAGGLATDLGMEALEGSDLSSMVFAGRHPVKSSITALADNEITDGLEACSGITALGGASLNDTFNNISDAIGNESLQLSLSERLAFNVCWAFAHVADAFDHDGSMGSSFKMAAIGMTQDDIAQQFCNIDSPVIKPNGLNF